MLCLHLRRKGSPTSGRAAAGLGEFTAFQQGPEAGQEQRLTCHAVAQRAAAPRTGLGPAALFHSPAASACLCPVVTEAWGLFVLILLGGYSRGLHATRVRALQARAEVITAKRSPGRYSPVCGLVAATQERWKDYLVRGDGLERKRRCHS